MADNTLQFKWIVLIKEGLETLFRHDPNVFVAGDLLWYPDEGEPRIARPPTPWSPSAVASASAMRHGEVSSFPARGSVRSRSRSRIAHLIRERRVSIAILVCLAILLVGIGLTWLWLRQLLRSSLPKLSGSLEVPGARGEIHIDRDALGVPTIRAAHHDDIAFGLGFVHAQDRFFQMDAIRRSAAGELAEIVGPGTDDQVLKLDRSVRRLPVPGGCPQGRGQARASRTAGGWIPTSPGSTRDCTRWAENRLNTFFSAEPRSVVGRGFDPRPAGHLPRPPGEGLRARVGTGRGPRCSARPARRLPLRGGLARLGRAPPGRTDQRAAHPRARGLRPEAGTGSSAPRHSARPDPSGGDGDPVRRQQ